MTHRTLRTIGALSAAALLALTSACSADSGDEATAADAVAIDDPWVKAATTEEGMTAAFGTLRNASDEDVTIVSATADVTDVVELHEMATDDDGQMVMRRKEGGVTIPAGETHALEPGGDHIMFLELPEDVAPGQDVTVTLTFSDDSTMSFTAPARSFSGAEENYDPESGEGSAGGMDHGETDHGTDDEGDHGDHDH